MTLNWRQIDGWLTEPEAHLLKGLAIQMPEGTVWCEIGSWKGKSTVCLAETGREGFAIDWFKGSPEHETGTNTYGEFVRNIEGFDNIHVIEGRSEEVKDLIPNNIGLLFIDGEHSYKGVSTDYNNYKDKVISGGFIVFHDAMPPRGYERNNPWPEVTTFVNELIEAGAEVYKTADRCVVIRKA